MHTLTAPAQPPLLTDVFEQAFGLYRRRFLTIFGIVAIAQAPIVALHFWLTLTLGKGLPDDSATLLGMLFAPANASGTVPLERIVLFFVASFAVALLQIMLVNQVVAGVLTHALVRQHARQPVTIFSAYALGWRRALTLVGAGMVATLASLCIGALGLLLAWSISGALQSNDLQSAASSGLLLLITAAATLVVLVALFIRVLFFPQAIVVEQIGAIRALRQSWELTGSALWRVLGSAALVWMLILIATGIPTACINFAVQFMYPRAVEDLFIRQMISLVVNDLFFIAALPLQWSAYTMLYFDLRARKEGHAARFE